MFNASCSLSHAEGISGREGDVYVAIADFRFHIPVACRLPLTTLNDGWCAWFRVERDGTQLVASAVPLTSPTTTTRSTTTYHERPPSPQLCTALHITRRTTHCPPPFPFFPSLPLFAPALPGCLTGCPFYAPPHCLL